MREKISQLIEGSLFEQLCAEHLLILASQMSRLIPALFHFIVSCLPFCVLFFLSSFSLFWHSAFVCVFVCVRYLSGSCLSGPSATLPAAMCKASTTWSRHSLSSTSLSTSVSAASPSRLKKTPWSFVPFAIDVGITHLFLLPIYCEILSPQCRGASFVAGKTHGGSSQLVTGNQPRDPFERLSLFTTLWSMNSSCSSVPSFPSLLCSPFSSDLRLNLS